MTTAIIYTRFSPRPNAQECDSCEKQEERCRGYCSGKDYYVCVLRSDKDTSGGVLDRPGLNAAIEDLRHTVGDKVLVVDSADRLARDMLVALTIRHEVEKAGGRIEYANGTPTAETPEGKLFGNILAAFAAYERDRVRYATSRGMKRRQENGEFFGKPPVGWMRDPWDSKRLVRHEIEQKAITRAKKLHQAGCSSAYVARRLTEVFGPFRGKPWSARTVRRIIAAADKDETS